MTLFPVRCPGCEEPWRIPADLLHVLDLPGGTNELWFACPDCGPAHFRLLTAYGGIVAAHGATRYNWQQLDAATVDQLTGGLCLMLDDSERALALDCELEWIVGHACTHETHPWHELRAARNRVNPPTPDSDQ